MGLRDSWNNYRNATGRNDTGAAGWRNRGAGQIGGRVGGALGAAAGPLGVAIGSLAGNQLGKWLSHRWNSRGANALPGSPSPDYTGHQVYDALGMPDYAHGGAGQLPPDGSGYDYTTGDQFVGPPAPEQPAAQPDEGGWMNRLLDSGAFGNAPGPGSHGGNAYGYHPTSLGNGGMAGTGSGVQGTSNVAGTMALMDAMGNFGPSFADQVSARWVSSKRQ